MKTGILLINLGTPDSPSVKDVRKYLTQFLNDPLVIDINPILRFFLVNFIIVPFRAPKSAALYKKTWTKEGSPLLIHTRNLSEKLQKLLGSDYEVEFAMRYKNPDIRYAFKNLKRKKVEKIIAIPLYPQYASSSTGSTLLELKKVMRKEKFSNVKIIEYFFEDENFLNSWYENSRRYFDKTMNEREDSEKSFDFYLFSYHGLPERQIIKECNKRGGNCNSVNDCELKNKNHKIQNPYCYRAACYETTRHLVKRLNIPEGKYQTSFQSRLNDKWLKPYSDKMVKEKAGEGVKRILVFSPAFVADCLETIYEIGIEYDEIFKQNGGEKLQLVPSLNATDHWVESLKMIILKNSC